MDDQDDGIGLAPGVGGDYAAAAARDAANKRTYNATIRAQPIGTRQQLNATGEPIGPKQVMMGRRIPKSQF